MHGKEVRGCDTHATESDTRVSGGRAFFTDDPERLTTIFEEILEDLRNQYLLAYAAPSNQRDGQWHDIRVKAGK